MKKRILILNTGGTISSIKKSEVYEPELGYVQKALTEIQALNHDDMPDYVIKEYDPLLDSSNITLDDWNRIAVDIKNNYEQFDGFVIFHGTDTMAYTASALSFMLENLSKPVIITGSQIPLSELRNDAVENIITAFWLCATQPLYEVCIYFNQNLLRGNRAQKVSAQGFKAFDSPNYPHLAKIGTTIELKKEFMLPKPVKSFNLQTLSPQFIANFRLFPGFKTEVLKLLFSQSIKGLILETYGSGNAPNTHPEFLALLKEASDQGVIIINCTQCKEGTVEMNHYATGFTLKKAGVISGHDMTPEAAHSKLLYLLSKAIKPNQVKKLIEMNLVGELHE